MPTFSIDDHPQRKKIVDALVAGQSVRDIAKWTNPPVSFNSIQRYRAAIVKPAMIQAKALAPILKKQKEISEDTEPIQLVQDAIRFAPVLVARENRIKALQDRHDRLNLIVNERGAEMATETPGGASGFLTRDYKGKDADRAIYKLDTGLLSEFREHEKQVAQEMGQWNEGAATNIAVQIVMPAGAQPGGFADDDAGFIDISAG